LTIESKKPTGNRKLNDKSHKSGYRTFEIAAEESSNTQAD
jgi:hypothetical protein